MFNPANKCNHTRWLLAKIKHLQIHGKAATEDGEATPSSSSPPSLSRKESTGEPISKKLNRSASTVAVLAAVEASKANDRSDSLSEAANGKCPLTVMMVVVYTFPVTQYLPYSQQQLVGRMLFSVYPFKVYSLHVEHPVLFCAFVDTLDAIVCGRFLIISLEHNLHMNTDFNYLCLRYAKVS